MGKNSFPNDVGAVSFPSSWLLASRELGAASLKAGKLQGDVVTSCILPYKRSGRRWQGSGDSAGWKLAAAGFAGIKSFFGEGEEMVKRSQIHFPTVCGPLLPCRRGSAPDRAWWWAGSRGRCWPQQHEYIT